METIRLKGISKKAKERIKQHGRGEHGDMFILRRRDGAKVHVESMEKSWRLLPGVPDTWAGWWTIGEEVEEVK